MSIRPTLYVYVAIISETWALMLFCMRYTLSKPIFIIWPQLRIRRTMMVGSMLGKSICHIFCSLEAPSTLAAS